MLVPKGEDKPRKDVACEVNNMSSTKRTEQLKKMPLIQTKIRRLKDSNLILHQTIISDLRPIEYYEAVVDRNNTDMETSVDNVMDATRLN